MNRNIYFYLFTILLFNNIALAQRGNVTFIEQECNHQIGIGISKFVNSAFPTDSSAFLLEYRYARNSKIAYRLALDYNIDTAKEGNYQGGMKMGIDRTFKKFQKWNFYYGIDLWGRYTYYTKNKRSITNVALNPFLGIMYRFSKNFSVSTEPGFFVKVNLFEDKNTFDLEKKREWIESRLSKIGYLQLNFHF